MELKSESVRNYLDGLPVSKKVTGHFATIEVIAYPDGHAAIGGHPLNGKEELLASVGYLFDRLLRSAASSRE